MAFDMSKIKGINRASEGHVGAGLLNEKSKNMETYNTTMYIKADRIIPNPKNEMSMDGIEALASQIKLSGLEQPLVVYQLPDGNYKILTGHRRFAAIQMLMENGDWDNDKPIECKVKDLNEMNVPLSFAGKEMLSILVTNQTRNKTDGDKAFEIREWKKIINELRQKGIEYLVVGFDEEGNEIKENIKGVRTVEIVGERMGISPAQVSNFDKVENKGTDELKQLLIDGKVNLNTAKSIADLPIAEQKEFIEKNKSDNITTKELAVYKKEKDTKNSDIPKGLISEKTFKNDSKKITKMLKTKGEVQLTDAQYADYCRYLNGLENLFK